MAVHDGIPTKVTVGVITGVILTALGYIERSWLPIAWSEIVWLFGVVWSWLATGHSVYGWLLIILIIFTTVACFCLVAALVYQIPQFNWSNYRQDTFLGFVWRWDYFGNRIGDPVPYCCHCDTQIVPQETSEYGSTFQRQIFTSYVCDHCNTNDKRNESFQQTQNKVSRQIDRKLRNDEWKKALPNATEKA